MKKLIVLAAIALSFSKLSAQEKFKSVTELGNGMVQTELIFENIETKEDAEFIMSRLRNNSEIEEVEFFDLKSQRIRLVSTRIFTPAEVRELLAGSSLLLAEKCLND